MVRERRNLPYISKFELRPGVQVRYGLKFDGQITDWSGFVEATDDQLSARKMVGLGLRRALDLEHNQEPPGAFSAA
ncbi:hypothetical protein GCM10008949_34260 [Deinococcus humi]|nr:hypothetical protein GCM10008949_34260 [Deinococcus humi]